MTDYFNKKEISQRAEDELLYEYVMEEMEQEPNYIKGLWAKAMAHSEGNNDKAKSLYMQYRVQSIKDDFKLLEIAYNELSKEKLWDTIKNSFSNEDEKQKIKQEQKEKQEEEKYGKIRGWLIFFAVLLVLWNLSQFGFVEYFKDEYVEAIQNMYLFGNEKMAKTFSYIFYSELFSAFMLFLFTLSFFTKSNITRIVGIWFFALMFIITPFKIAGLLNIYNEINEVPLTEIVKMIGSLLWALIFLLYFIFSKRVKKTFIHQKDNTTITIISLIIPLILLFSYNSKNGTPSSYDLKNTAFKIANKYFESKDYTNANTYYEIAIRKGYDPHTIAEKYFEKEKYNESIQWYKKAVDKGDKSAKFRLAYSYNTIKDYDNAIKYYNEYLTYSEYEIAMNNLANVYRWGKKDYKNAIKWHKKAIEKGYKHGHFAIAYSYDMLKDYKNAVIWYKKAIKQNSKDESSLWNLALIYDKGKGKVSKNQKKAFDLFLKAARLDYKNAMEQVAYMYKYGYGVTQDRTKAKYWENKSK